MIANFPGWATSPVPGLTCFTFNPLGIFIQLTSRLRSMLTKFSWLPVQSCTPKCQVIAEVTLKRLATHRQVRSMRLLGMRYHRQIHDAHAHDPPFHSKGFHLPSTFSRT